MTQEALKLAAGIAKPFEGLILAPYHDPVGFPTIGYGHLLSRDPWASLDQWQAISEDEAHNLLESDMMKAARAVDRLIHVPLNDHQRASLIDFAFNCGAGNLQSSTLRRLLNKGDYKSTPAQLMRWVYARGQKLNGLIKRRQAEAKLWNQF